MRLATITFALLFIPALLACEDDESEASSTESSTESAQEGADQAGQAAHEAIAAAAQGQQPPGDPHANLPTNPSAPDAPQVQDPDNPSVGGIGWEAPEPFRYQRPNMQMRAAEYLVPEEEGEQAATMTVSFFPGMGGSVQDNLDRWIGQFTQPDGSSSADAAQVEQKEISGLTVHLLDVSGTFSGGGPAMGGGQPLPDRRMLAAIVVGPRGPVFFKLVGQQSLMQRAEGPFGQLVDSLRPL